MRRFAVLTLLVLAVRPATGQGSVADDLQKAKEAYGKSNVEMAKNLFAGIIASRQQVTPEQRVTAYKYLGAYWALQSSPGARDSSNLFFLAALDNDPFTELERDVFAPDEQAAFARARSGIFRVGLAPIEPKVVDPASGNPDTNRYNFRVVSTKSARLTISIVKLNDPGNATETFPTIGANDGVRDIVWNGLINNQRADTGIYELRVQATDNARAGATPTTETQKFRIDHHFAKLEDTLPSFKDVVTGGTDTLKSRYSSFRPYADGGRGLFIASFAAALPFIVLPRDDMSGWKSHFGFGITLGGVAGIGGFMYATSHRDDGRAAAENARRRNIRAQYNAGVLARNRARLDRTILIIRPLTSAGIAG